MSGLTIGGGAVALSGLGVATYGFASRTHNRHETRMIPEYQRQLVTREADAEAAHQATIRARPVNPPGLTAQEAVVQAKELYGTGQLFIASTADGDRAGVGAAQILPSAFHTPNEAGAEARARSGGRSTAVLEVGDWYVPVVLDQALAPKEHSRTVPYTDIEYTYTYGYNSATGQTESYYGPQTVTRYRDEDYLSKFNRFEPAKAGVQQAANGAGDLMNSLGTPVEQHETAAVAALRAAEGRLAAARRSEAKGPSAGNGFMVGGVLAAVAGAGLLGYGLMHGRI